VLAGCWFQIFDRLLRVFSVSNQIVRPSIIVKSALTTTRKPWNLSQPRVMGITIAGTETRNVTKTKTAFAIAAVQILVLSSHYE
jgi:hypothetical protein